jgi:hypothetical protein
MKVTCNTCGAEIERNPSRCGKINYCSHKCRYRQGRLPIIGIKLVKIPMKNGMFAIVDRTDWDNIEELRNFSWNAVRSNSRTLYAARSHNYFDKIKGRKTCDMVFMHDVILGVKDGLKVDHFDENGLNNIRSNIRTCSNAQNVWRQGKRRNSENNKSKYIGLSYYPGNPYNPWRAGITVNGKRMHLGYFATEEEAARARDEAALKLHGEFAYLNFPS